MRIKRFISIICLFVLSFTMTLDAQTLQQRETLLRMSDEFGRRFEREKAEAVRLAESLGLVIRQEFADGTVMELMRFKDGMPMYYITHNAGGASLINSDKVYPGGIAGLELTGAGQTLGIWDGGAVHHTHQEFMDDGTSRVTQKDAPGEYHWHASHVAGTMIAEGVETAARGMSYEALLDAYDWNNDQAEMTAAAAGGLQVSQHSYGVVTGWDSRDWSGYGGWHWFGNTTISETEDYNFGFYSSQARDWDEIAHNAPNYLIVKSAGNDRGEGPAPGTPHYVRSGDYWVTSTKVREVDGGSDGYNCISHAGLAKNVMTVGAVTSARDMSSFSGWGPSDDGRVKPDIVAKGVSVYSPVDGGSGYGSASGTSMSGPMVSGSVGLLLEHQANLHPGEKLLASTIKALILHSADSDIGGEPGPDYSFGWGLMDTERAAQIMTENSLADGIHINEMTITDGNSVTMPVKASGSEPLRATIVWTDPPGTPPQPSLNPPDLMLVNDLDMRITNTEKTEYMPYILDPANPSNPATTGDNYRDNVEMIHIDNPTAEEIYTITITHKGTLTGGSQDFSLIITGNMGLTDVANPHSFTATAIDASQIDLDWTKNNDGDDVMLVWSPDNVFGIPTEETIYSVGSNIPGGGTVLFRGSGTDFSHTGLAGATTYYYRAYSYDETDSYSTGINASAMTDCGVITILPFEENFDSSVQVPLCWTVTDNIGNGQVWQFGTINDGLTGTTGNYAYVDSDAYGSGNTQNTGLITPVLDLSAYSHVKLSFTHYFEQYEQSEAVLFYSIDGGNTWVEIQKWTVSTANPTYFDEQIPAVAGESAVMFKWLYTGTWDFYWCVDDIRISDDYAEIVIDPTSLSEILFPDQTSARQLNIANPDGNIPLNWRAVVSSAPAAKNRLFNPSTQNEARLLHPAETDPSFVKQKMTTGNKALFDLLDHFPMAVGGGEYAVATDGSFIYTTKWNGNEYYRYTMEGVYVDAFDIEGAGNTRDLAFDGTYFYGSPNTTTVYQMDFKNQTVVGTFEAPSVVRGLAYDRINDAFWVSDNWSGPLSLVNLQGEVLQTLDLPVDIESIAGMEWEDVSDGAPAIWLYRQTGSGHMLTKIDISTGAAVQHYDVYETGVIGPETTAGGLAITNHFALGKWVLMGMSQNDVIWVLELEPDDFWLSLDPSSGEVDPGGSVNMDVLFDASELTPGTYNAQIRIRHDGTSLNKSNIEYIPVELVVDDEGVPETRSLSGKTVTDGDTECFDATQTITVSEFVVESGGSATLIAGQSITLLPGTHIQSGGYFHAWITTDDTYCGEPVAKELDPEEIVVTVPEIPQRIREDLFFKVYPNPTDGSFTLELETTDQDNDIVVDIMNMLGERVLSDRLPSQNIHTLTLEGQRPGMYIIRVTKGTRSGVERLIKR